MILFQFTLEVGKLGNIIYFHYCYFLHIFNIYLTYYVLLDTTLLSLLQLFGGLVRSPSMEFKELTKKDAQVQMGVEVQKLLSTCESGVPKEEATKEMEGFDRLFSRFINETGPSVHWEHIHKLDDNMVCAV